MSFFDDKYTEVDDKLMEDGVEVDFGSGFFVKVRHVSSQAVTDARSAITKKLKVMSRNKALTPEQNKQVTSHVVAHGGLVGWRGGDVPTFSPDFAETVFKKRPEFLEDCITAMTEYDAFRKEQVDDAVGNSSQSSNGD